ncbi:MAG: DUF6134 family protein [Parvibaculales bacterium]
MFSTSAVADTVSRDWLGGVPDDGFLAYEISRKGKPLGFQTLTFSRSESGELIVDVHIEIDFKLGPIPLFRYLHDNREVWRDGVLLSMKSKTYNNGEDVTADLKLEDGRYVGSGSRFEDNLEAPMLSTSYFNPNFIRQSALISTQDGRLLEPQVETLGVETLNIGGAPVQATRFRLSGKLSIDIWYTDAGRWVKTEFSRGGNTLVVKQTNPARIPPRKKWRHP